MKNIQKIYTDPFQPLFGSESENPEHYIRARSSLSSFHYSFQREEFLGNNFLAAQIDFVSQFCRKKVGEKKKEKNVEILETRNGEAWLCRR